MDDRRFSQQNHSLSARIGISPSLLWPPLGRNKTLGLTIGYVGLLVLQMSSIVHRLSCIAQQVLFHGGQDNQQADDSQETIVYSEQRAVALQQVMHLLGALKQEASQASAALDP
jgi:hypothetical protein